MHQVHAPEIELTSPTTARGIWALNDIVRLAPGLNLDGWGHYHETYEKIDGQWRITSSTLTRLRTDFFNPLFSVRISDRLTRAAAKLDAPLEQLVETLLLDSLVHPPTLGGADELVDVPEPAKHDLVLVPAEHHRVEAEGSR